MSERARGVRRRNILRTAGGFAVAGLIGRLPAPVRSQETELSGVADVTIGVDGSQFAAISDDGQLIATEHEEDDGVIVVEERTPAEEDGTRTAVVEELDHPGDVTHGLAFSPDGGKMGVLVRTPDGGERGLVVYETETWTVEFERTLTSWNLRGVAFSPDSSHVAWGRGNGEVWIHDTETGSREHTLESADLVEEPWRSFDQSFSPEFFAHANDAGVHVYEYPGFDRIDVFEDVGLANDNAGHAGVALSPDSAHLAYADESAVVVRETDSWETVARLTAPEDDVRQITFVGTERIAYTAEDPGTLFVSSVGGDWELLESQRVDGVTLSESPMDTADETDELLMVWPERVIESDDDDQETGDADADDDQETGDADADDDQETGDADADDDQEAGDADDGEEAGDGTDDVGADDDGAGFGAGGFLTAVGAVSYLLKRRLTDDTVEPE